MKFNDTAPVLAPAGGPPLWLARLAENATLEATVLKRPIEGRADILSVIKPAYAEPPATIFVLRVWDTRQNR